MAICSGCSANCGCSLTVSNPDPSLTLTLLGDGSAANQWILSGVASGGGGGSCNQKTVYTVATVGTTLSGVFGLDVATPEPFRSCADFIGDGVNDNVAIQAAFDAAAPVSPGTPADKVLLLPGFFRLTATMDLKGVGLSGTRTTSSVLVPASAFGRIFSNTGFNGSLNDFSLLSVSTGLGLSLIHI